MRKLVLSVAVLGLVGLSPAHAHKAEGVRCRAKILSITPHAGTSTQPAGWQVVKTRLRVTNLTDEARRPGLDADIYDLHSGGQFDDEIIGNDQLFGYKLEPGESKVQTSLVNVDPSASVDEIRVDHCHRSRHGIGEEDD